HQSDLEQLRAWLSEAAVATRLERARALGIGQGDPELISRQIRRRARDWSEVRPEWALARNAAFIAARRARTRGVCLEGRAFLHEYDWTTDPDNSILTLILTAPVVVASWINLQYFGSTVDNAYFGCGTKTIHNRVGTLGVVLGNGGDLRTGLALQSVQGPDGRWYHEPMRLQVVVEAPRERIEAVMQQHAVVRDLVENGWLRLFALDPEGTGATRWVPGAGWEG
ncbi:MAG: putative inorganic carbon transporter subunit DabA, partial [Chloroflexaceae bacterium]